MPLNLKITSAPSERGLDNSIELIAFSFQVESSHFSICELVLLPNKR